MIERRHHEAPHEFQTALTAARTRLGRAEGSVLDILQSQASIEQHPKLLRWLHEDAGARALCTVDDIDPDSIKAVTCILSDGSTRSAVEIRFNDEPSTRIALADPWDSATTQSLFTQLGRLPELACASDRVLRQICGSGSSITDVRRASPQANLDVPTFVDQCIQSAYQIGASDIHFETSRTGLVVKLRLNGVMTAHASSNDAAFAPEAISRIKVMSQLDITERRVPQDGRMRVQVDGAGVDVRVSIMPSLFGEDAVLRLLDKAHLRSQDDSISLEGLGFGGALLGSLRDLGSLPHGMLLVTGPTGSGKTTTIYAMLSEVNRGGEKIVTIEDPVEYELHGVLQIPVNEKKGLTFATGLRSILRHDPDKILVGEIRDAETAEIAVQSALTGHQVYTTVHANSIYDVFGRFRHFGIDMFGFMSALNGVVVQRLLRTVCERCAGARDAKKAEILWLDDGVNHGAVRVVEPMGCAHCHGTGYAGRTVIAEAHVVDDSLRDLVTSLAPISAIRAHVNGTTSNTLTIAARHLVRQGKTTMEEVKRVVGA